MKTIAVLEKRVQSAPGARDGWELRATANAKYDLASSALVIELDASMRPRAGHPVVERITQPWIPKKRVIKRRVRSALARATAKEVFAVWVTQVRRAIPPPPQAGED